MMRFSGATGDAQVTANVEELKARALKSWYAQAKKAGAPVEEGPTAAASTMEEVGGLSYIVLRGEEGGPLAVYRIRANDGVLKRLRRPPKELLGS